MDFLRNYLGFCRTMMTPEIYQMNFSKLIFNVIAIVSAVVILALFIATAVLSKKQRVIGIIASVANVASALTIPMFVRSWHMLGALISDWFIAMDGEPTVEAAYAILMDAVKILVVVLVATAIMMVAFALTIVYIAKSFKNKPAIFSAIALALIIFRQLFVAPFQMFFPLIVKIFMQNWEPSLFMYSQAVQLVIYFGIMIVSLALVLVPVIIKKIKGEDAPKAAKAPAEDEPSAE